MNDADKFLRDADALLRGEIPMTDDADEQALRLLARDLMTADFSAETDLDALRPAVLRANMKGKTRMSRRARTLLTIAAVVSLVAAAFLTVPPLRAFAQEILRQIGIYNVTDAPTWYEETQKPISVTNLIKRDGVAALTDLSRARVEMRSVPEGYQLVGHNLIHIVPGRPISFVETVYVKSDNLSVRVSVQQLQKFAEDMVLDFNGTRTETGNINGIPATVVEGFAEQPNTRLLVWEMEGYLVWLQGTGVSIEELYEIAGLVSMPEPEISETIAIVYSDPKEAAVASGSPVAIINPLPPGYYVSARITQRDESHSMVYTFYHRSWARNPNLFSLQQYRVTDESSEPWSFAIGESQFEDVMVNGNPGIWVADTYANSSIKQNVLMWEQEGFTLILQGSGVEKDEMLAIAQTIEFIDADFEGDITEPRAINQYDRLMSTVYVPDDVPEGYSLQRRERITVDDIPTIASTYVSDDGSDVFVIQQMEYPSNTTLQDLTNGVFAESEAVTVNAWRGLWFGEYPRFSNTYGRMLIWPQYGYIMRIHHAGFSREETLRIAESMRKSISMDAADFE